MNIEFLQFLNYSSLSQESSYKFELILIISFKNVCIFHVFFCKRAQLYQKNLVNTQLKFPLKMSETQVWVVGNALIFIIAKDYLYYTKHPGSLRDGSQSILHFSFKLFGHICSFTVKKYGSGSQRDPLVKTYRHSVTFV